MGYIVVKHIFKPGEFEPDHTYPVWGPTQSFKRATRQRDIRNANDKNPRHAFDVFESDSSGLLDWRK